MDRREFALGAGALALSSALIGAAAAQSEPSARARAVWRRSVVLDCNLGPPLGADTFPQPQDALDAARNSGVSAIKTSIGGFNASFEDTFGELAFFQRLIEAHPDYFMQIRVAADIAAAKRERKLGIIFSFESAACLEDKIDLSLIHI